MNRRLPWSQVLLFDEPNNRVQANKSMSMTKTKKNSVYSRTDYELKVVLFELRKAPATFPGVMSTVLAGLKWHTCLVFLDDI